MPETRQEHIKPSFVDVNTAGHVQVESGVSGVITEVLGAIESSQSGGVYWVQFWDGDPSGTGTFITSFPVDHTNGSDTPIPSEKVPGEGVYCASEMWVNISTSAHSDSGSIQAKLSVGYQKDQ